jgi:hypothetical protein
VARCASVTCICFKIIRPDRLEENCNSRKDEKLHCEVPPEKMSTRTWSKCMYQSADDNIRNREQTNCMGWVMGENLSPHRVSRLKTIWEAPSNKPNVSDTNANRCPLGKMCSSCGRTVQNLPYQIGVMTNHGPSGATTA